MLKTKFPSVNFFFFFFLAVPRGMWDVRSRPGIEPPPPVLEVRSLNHRTAGKVPSYSVLSYRGSSQPTTPPGGGDSPAPEELSHPDLNQQPRHLAKGLLLLFSLGDPPFLPRNLFGPRCFPSEPPDGPTPYPRSSSMLPVLPPPALTHGSAGLPHVTGTGAFWAQSPLAPWSLEHCLAHHSDPVNLVNGNLPLFSIRCWVGKEKCWLFLEIRGNSGLMMKQTHTHTHTHA